MCLNKVVSGVCTFHSFSPSLLLSFSPSPESVQVSDGTIVWRARESSSAAKHGASGYAECVFPRNVCLAYRGGVLSSISECFPPKVDRYLAFPLLRLIDCFVGLTRKAKAQAKAKAKQSNKTNKQTSKGKKTERSITPSAKKKKKKKINKVLLGSCWLFLLPLLSFTVCSFLFQLTSAFKAARLSLALASLALPSLALSFPLQPINQAHTYLLTHPCVVYLSHGSPLFAIDTKTQTTKTNLSQHQGQPYLSAAFLFFL